jgi:alanine racemase
MQVVAKISQSALEHNINYIKSLSPSSKIMSMVKANAYGHQIEYIEPILSKSDYLAVSELSEGIELRKLTKKPIVILSGPFNLDDLTLMIDNEFQFVIHEMSQVSLITSSAKDMTVWLKLDSGMHRLGFSIKDFSEVIKTISRHKNIKIESLMTHFANADDPQNLKNDEQLNCFKEKVQYLEFQNSLCNSAALMNNEELHFDIIRPGIMLYGISPFHQKDKNLKPVMEISAPIMSIRHIKKGESVGYGSTYTADKDTNIATIGIGYGDGYPRHAKNGTPILINGKKYPLAGRVSMDLITVDISNDYFQIGEKAILWGNENLPIEQVAEFAGTIGYELTSRLTSRVQFQAAK